MINTFQPIGSDTPLLGRTCKWLHESSRIDAGSAWCSWSPWTPGRARRLPAHGSLDRTAAFLYRDITTTATQNHAVALRQRMVVGHSYLQDNQRAVAEVCRIVFLAHAHEGRHTAQQHLHTGPADCKMHKRKTTVLKTSQLSCIAASTNSRVQCSACAGACRLNPGAHYMKPYTHDMHASYASEDWCRVHVLRA